MTALYISMTTDRDTGHKETFGVIGRDGCIEYFPLTETGRLDALSFMLAQEMQELIDNSQFGVGS